MRSGTGSATGTAIRIAVIGYAVAMLAVAIAVLLVGDSNAVGMLLLFGPRWLLVFPWLVLVPLSLFVSRRLFLAALVGAAITFFFASGFEVPYARLLNRGAHAPGQTLRVVTYNSDRSVTLSQRIASDLVTWDADIVLIQDCARETAEALKRAPVSSFRLVLESEFCALSRLSIVGDVAVQSARGEGRALSFDVQVGTQRVSVTTVHLPSPRSALWAARNGRVDMLEQSVRQRSGASRFIADWVSPRQGSKPAVVAGDFNMAAESRALRDDWPALRNSFSDAGWGFGHTMFAGRHRVRIDHVLVSRQFVVRGAHVLSGFPSEHQPVVVDLQLEMP